MTKNHDPDEMPVDEWRHRKRRFSPSEQGPTTICFARLCIYADHCPNKTAHPRRIPQSSCARYWPEDLRPQPTFSTNTRTLIEQITAGGSKARGRARSCVAVTH